MRAPLMRLTGYTCRYNEQETKAVAGGAMFQAVNRLPLARCVRDDSETGSFE